MQKVKILMRRLDVSSGFSLFANVCPNLPAVRSYLTLPYMHFFVVLAFFSFQLKTIRSEKSPLDMDASTVVFLPFQTVHEIQKCIWAQSDQRLCHLLNAKYIYHI